MKNILVPIDGSQPSRNALQHAIDIANAYSAELTIVNITNADAVLDSFDVFEDMTDEKVKDLTKLAKDKSGYVLEKAMDAVPENLMVHTVQLVSTPEIGILSEADKCNADLIVMGRRGSHSLSEQLLGSASTYVLAHAKCPVLLAHNEKEGPYQRILVPADGSEESLKAVRYAVEFAKADGASVTIFHVANMRDLIAEETALDQKKRGLEDLTDRLRQSRPKRRRRHPLRRQHRPSGPDNPQKSRKRRLGPAHHGQPRPQRPGLDPPGQRQPLHHDPFGPARHDCEVRSSWLVASAFGLVVRGSQAEAVPWTVCRGRPDKAARPE